MRISRKEDYAVLLLCALSREQGTFASIDDLSKRYHTPLSFTQQIATALVRKGLLRSKEGMNGGYQLARSPETITLSEVLSAIGANQQLTDCTVENSSCTLQRWCPTQTSWKTMHEIVHQLFSSITLAHVASGNLPPLGNVK